MSSRSHSTKAVVWTKGQALAWIIYGSRRLYHRPEFARHFLSIGEACDLLGSTLGVVKLAVAEAEAANAGAVGAKQCRTPARALSELEGAIDGGDLRPNIDGTLNRKHVVNLWKSREGRAAGKSNLVPDEAAVRFIVYKVLTSKRPSRRALELLRKEMELRPFWRAAFGYVDTENAAAWHRRITPYIHEAVRRADREIEFFKTTWPEPEVAHARSCVSTWATNEYKSE
jgi:hypothetical protein